MEAIGNSLGDTGRFLGMLKPIRTRLAKPVSCIGLGVEQYIASVDISMDHISLYPQLLRLLSQSQVFAAKGCKMKFAPSKWKSLVVHDDQYAGFALDH